MCMRIINGIYLQNIVHDLAGNMDHIAVESFTCNQETIKPFFVHMCFNDLPIGNGFFNIIQSYLAYATLIPGVACKPILLKTDEFADLPDVQDKATSTA